MSDMDEFKFPPFKEMSMEMTFANVDPEVLEFLTGMPVVDGKIVPPEPTFAIEVVTPIKRKWWQWLLRRPRKYRTVYIPNARMAGPE